MNIISIYSQYVGLPAQKIGRQIEGSDGLVMVTKHANLTAELHKLRADCIVFDAEGMATAKPGGEGKRISELETKRKRLEKIAAEYGEVLESIGINDPTHVLNGDPHRKKAGLESVAKSGPNRCWHQFNIMHGKHPEIMPFDLARDSEYQKVEQEQRIRMAGAEKELEKLKAAIKRLEKLAVEAREL